MQRVHFASQCIKVFPWSFLNQTTHNFFHKLHRWKHISKSYSALFSSNLFYSVPFHCILNRYCKIWIVYRQFSDCDYQAKFCLWWPAVLLWRQNLHFRLRIGYNSILRGTCKFLRHSNDGAFCLHYNQLDKAILSHYWSSQKTRTDTPLLSTRLPPRANVFPGLSC